MGFANASYASRWKEMYGALWMDEVLRFWVSPEGFVGSISILVYASYVCPLLVVRVGSDEDKGFEIH